MDNCAGVFPMGDLRYSEGWATSPIDCDQRVGAILVGHNIEAIEGDTFRKRAERGRFAVEIGVAVCAAHAAQFVKASASEAKHRTQIARQIKDKGEWDNGRVGIYVLAPA